MVSSVSPNSTNGNGSRSRRVRPEHVSITVERLERLVVVFNGSTGAFAALENGALRGVREALAGQIDARGNGAVTR